MATLYIDEYGANIHVKDGLLCVEKDDEQIASVRIQELDSVILVENCGVTSSALKSCLRESVAFTVLSYNGEYLGRLEPKIGKNIGLRYQQYSLSSNTEFCLSLAKRFVAAKLANMRTILMRYRQSSVENAELDQSITRMKDSAKAAGAAEDLSQLLGIEGSGSREYFASLKFIVESPFTFDGRNRRPPKDPVNAMLGFTYALLENFVETGVCIWGLDPFCGFFHCPEYGRESIVLDLMEELRPVIADSVVLNCCSRHIVDPEADFEERDGGVFLNEHGREKIFAAFYSRMRVKVKADSETEAQGYEKVCVDQAQSLASAIRESKPELYTPFLIK